MSEYYTGESDSGKPKAIFERYKDTYLTVSNDQITQIREKYVIIDIDSLEDDTVTSATRHSYFDNQQKTEAVCDMLYYYLNHKNRYIYKKTDYLCNKKEEFCLCNTYAEALQVVFSDNATPLNGNKTISWFKNK